MQRFGKQFSAERLVNSQRKPDRYAAAICIRVRSDGSVARIFCWRKLPPVRAAKGGTDLRRYPDSMRLRRTVTSFSSWLSSLLSLPSSLSLPCSPLWSQCKSTIDLHTFRIHHNYKIDTACFEEGKRRLAPCGRTRPSLLRRHSAPLAGSRRGEVFMWSEEAEDSEAEQSPWSLDPMIDQSWRKLGVTGGRKVQ
jgi:hypothetical protein